MLVSNVEWPTRDSDDDTQPNALEPFEGFVQSGIDGALEWLEMSRMTGMAMLRCVP
ncbi:uncharacterized protein PHACADRAFT_260258 [Phanerochaete carnosa HHB-10118-sp]|uniref:Uncharacterized protein n=1 Tax=Phanerochaete carnosa (strain HHB-10118-sp) TaxID=650164 RepID=K5W486_PHACS|nr:uncharacterized protein PHACADRAFT_260258 [Phanerochaete carnosa HHB-10118-sp]EKM53764.1 hypothetical protein PHACADRAFT_260258 [Phanerochaete carnosa HHB-10118-sp]